MKTGTWERITLVDYKEHTIFATATKEATGKWIPHVTITWTSAGRQREHRLYPLVVQDKLDSDYILTTFTNPAAADHLAVQVAKTWVDEHIVKCSQKRAYVVSEQTNRASKDLGHA